jgi:hypothetical protein
VFEGAPTARGPAGQVNPAVVEQGMEPDDFWVVVGGKGPVSDALPSYNTDYDR